MFKWDIYVVVKHRRFNKFLSFVNPLSSLPMKHAGRKWKKKRKTENKYKLRGSIRFVF